MKYNILIDYGSDGWSLWGEEYDTLDEAVKAAVKNSYGNEFNIIQIIDWKAEEGLI